MTEAICTCGHDYRWHNNEAASCEIGGCKCAVYVAAPGPGEIPNCVIVHMLSTYSTEVRWDDHVYMKATAERLCQELNNSVPGAFFVRELATKPSEILTAQEGN